MPLNSVPLNSVPLNSVPLNSVPLNSVPLNSVPLNSVPLNSVPLNSVPLNSVPLNSTPFNDVITSSTSDAFGNPVTVSNNLEVVLDTALAACPGGPVVPMMVHDVQTATPPVTAPSFFLHEGVADEAGAIEVAALGLQRKHSQHVGHLLEGTSLQDQTLGDIARFCPHTGLGPYSVADSCLTDEDGKIIKATGAPCDSVDAGCSCTAADPHPQLDIWQMMATTTQLDTWRDCTPGGLPSALPGVDTDGNGIPERDWHVFTYQVLGCDEAVWDMAALVRLKDGAISPYDAEIYSCLKTSDVISLDNPDQTPKYLCSRVQIFEGIWFFAYRVVTGHPERQSPGHRMGLAREVHDGSYHFDATVAYGTMTPIVNRDPDPTYRSAAPYWHSQNPLDYPRSGSADFVAAARRAQHALFRAAVTLKMTSSGTGISYSPYNKEYQRYVSPVPQVPLQGALNSCETIAADHGQLPLVSPLTFAVPASYSTLSACEEFQNSGAEPPWTGAPEQRDYGWVRDGTGSCMPGSRSVVGAGANALHCERPIGMGSLVPTMLRVCPGQAPCTHAGALERWGGGGKAESSGACETIYPSIDFECPSSGRFSVMRGTVDPALTANSVWDAWAGAVPIIVATEPPSQMGTDVAHSVLGPCPTSTDPCGSDADCSGETPFCNASGHCAAGGEDRECGFTQLTMTGLCAPFLPVTIGAGVDPSDCNGPPLGSFSDQADPILRICDGQRPCSFTSPSTRGHSHNACGVHRPGMTFICGPSGTFTVMSAPYKDGDPNDISDALTPGIRTGQNAVYPASVELAPDSASSGLMEGDALLVNYTVPFVGPPGSDSIGRSCTNRYVWGLGATQMDLVGRCTVANLRDDALGRFGLGTVMAAYYDPSTRWTRCSADAQPVDATCDALACATDADCGTPVTAGACAQGYCPVLKNRTVFVEVRNSQSVAAAVPPKVFVPVAGARLNPLTGPHDTALDLDSLRALNAPACTSDAACATGESCNPICSNGCIDDGDCVSGALCHNSTCTKQCTTDSECEPGRCQEGECVDLCNFASQCTGPGAACVAQACTRACVADGECPSGRCSDGLCAPRCEGQTEATFCARRCNSDGDCGGNGMCYDGTCANDHGLNMCGDTPCCVAGPGAAQTCAITMPCGTGISFQAKQGEPFTASVSTSSVGFTHQFNDGSASAGTTAIFNHDYVFTADFRIGVCGNNRDDDHRGFCSGSTPCATGQTCVSGHCQLVCATDADCDYGPGGGLETEARIHERCVAGLCACLPDHPIQALAGSACGNGVCDRDLLENPANCSRDCSSGPGRTGVLLMPDINRPFTQIPAELTEVPPPEHVTPDTTPPVFCASPGGETLAYAESGLGAKVTFEVVAVDPELGGDCAEQGTWEIAETPVYCSHASGAMFPIGLTDVTCASPDARGNLGRPDDGFAVRVTDVIVDVPGALAADATSHAGAEVSFEAGAHRSYETVPPAEPVQPGSCPRPPVPAAAPITLEGCEADGQPIPPPTDGSDTWTGSFGVKTTTVVCTARDSADQPVTGSFTVTVTDHLPTDGDPPVISVAGAGGTFEATSPAGATVSYSVTATDDVDGAIPLSPAACPPSGPPAPGFCCTPPSGSTFALGSATVQCAARDTQGNLASASFAVQVLDTTGPVIAGPLADVHVAADDAGGATVAYVTPVATDAVDPAPVVTCAPASGTRFALGTTTVTCTASDALGNASTATFTVEVGCSTTFPPPVTPPGSDCTITTTVKSKAALLAWIAGPRTTNLLVLKATSGGYDFGDGDVPAIETRCWVHFNPGAPFTHVRNMSITAMQAFLRNDVLSSPVPGTVTIRAGGPPPDSPLALEGSTVAIEIYPGATTTKAYRLEGPTVVVRGDVSYASGLDVCAGSLQTMPGAAVRGTAASKVLLRATAEITLAGELSGAGKVTIVAPSVELRPTIALGTSTARLGDLSIAATTFIDRGDIRASGRVTIAAGTSPAGYYRLYPSNNFQVAGDCELTGTRHPQSVSPRGTCVDLP